MHAIEQIIAEILQTRREAGRRRGDYLERIHDSFADLPAGVNVTAWKPTGTGTGFTLSPTLKPVDDAGLKPKVTVVTGTNAIGGPRGHRLNGPSWPGTQEDWVPGHLALVV